MALRDYRLCDRCGEKAFYDANLPYRQEDQPQRYGGTVPYLQAGEPTWHQTILDRVGDWAVLCNECSKTHRTIIVPIVKTNTERVAR